MQHSGPHSALRTPPSRALSCSLGALLLSPSQFSGIPWRLPSFLLAPSSHLLLPGLSPFPASPPPQSQPDSEGRERTELRTGGGAAPASRSSSDAAAAALRSPARAPRQLRSALAAAAPPAPLPACQPAGSPLSEPQTPAERVMSQSAPGRRGESKRR